LLETHPSASLETIRRQLEPWQQQASEHFAAGRVPTALDAYDQAGRLHWTDTRVGARAELVARYLADRADHPAGSQLIVAYRNADARGINEDVREARRAAGELAQPAVAIGGKDYTAERQFGFPVERAIFLEVLHRLVAPGSDRAAYAWREAYGTTGTEELDLHHAYRAMAWLGEPTGETDADGVRTTKDRIEEELFTRRRDLFSSLQLVFFDTTSLYFEGAGGESLGDCASVGTKHGVV